VDAIVAEELRKQYKDVQALDGVSFAVREGEVFGLLGPNGAGTSTTVRVLTTHYLEEADRLAERVAIVSLGKVVVEGTPDELKRGLRGESVTVELSNGAGEAAERIVAAHADQVHVDGHFVRARVPNGAAAIPVLLGALDAAGVAVASVTTARPSLDDVYLHYTGRDFSSDDA
jgi:ABC-2 type transport system ATP-binding protein